MNNKLYLGFILLLSSTNTYAGGSMVVFSGFVTLAIILQILLIILDYKYTHKKFSYSFLLIFLCFIGWVTFFSTGRDNTFLQYLQNNLHINENVCYIMSLVVCIYIIPFILKIIITAKLNKS